MNNSHSPITIPVFAGQVTLKPLAFDPAALQGLPERLIRSHRENNYGGSVKTPNTVKQHLVQALADNQMDYGAAARHLDAFSRNIQWEAVTRCDQAALRATAA